MIISLVHFRIIYVLNKFKIILEVLQKELNVQKILLHTTKTLNRVQKLKSQSICSTTILNLQIGWGYHRTWVTLPWLKPKIRVKPSNNPHLPLPNSIDIVYKKYNSLINMQYARLPLNEDSLILVI